MKIGCYKNVLQYRLVSCCALVQKLSGVMANCLALTAGVLVLSVLICCQQPVEIITALNWEMDVYRRLAQYAAQVSMNISLMMTNMTEAIFLKSDEWEESVNRLEEQVITKAQLTSTKSVNATECVHSLMILKSLKEMTAHIQKTNKCLHDEANKNAFHETQVGKTLHHHRSHVMEGRRAKEKCSLAPEFDFREKCLAKISEEMRFIEKVTLASLDEIHKEATKLRNNLTERIETCNDLCVQYVASFQNNVHKLDRCLGLT